jgi:predicted negative regulator of RcsB-dependent stress response
MNDSLKVGLGLMVLFISAFGMLIGLTIYQNYTYSECVANVSQYNSNVSEVKDLCRN